MSGPGSERIKKAVSDREDEILEWTKKLISFPSENRPPDGAEAEAQEFLGRECRELGLEVDVFSPEEIPDIRQHPSWLEGRNYPNGRRDLVARWRGRGEGKALLLSGHVDVAPFEPDDWKVCRPYEPVVRDGRLYGRGAADMKGGLAAAFWALRILKDLGFEPAGDILYESLVDEEFAGGNGTLAARLRGHNADLAVVAEPTGMELCHACFGAFLGELTLAGEAGMPFLRGAVPNALNGAARAIGLFAEWEEKWRAKNSHPAFDGPGKELKVLLWRISSGKPGEFTQMGTPLLATIGWIVWCHPGMTEAEFYRRFRAFWQEHAAADPALAPFRLEVRPAFHFVRPWETPADDPAVRAVAQAFRRCEGREPVITGAPVSCDLAIYGETGKMPSVLLGPGGGNIHAPDEYVQIADILSLTNVFANLAVLWSGALTPAKSDREL